MKRKLAAILVGDVVGYTALMEQSEERTAERLTRCQAAIASKVVSLEGRVFKTAGDAALAEFPSAVNALRAAVEIRSYLAGMQDDPDPLRMRFGLHIADVMAVGDDLVGDGINVAARIQGAADPDAIDVSAPFFENVRRSAAFIFDDLGDRSFKNIAEPMRVYRVRGEKGSHRLLPSSTRSASDAERRPSSIAVLPFRVSSDIAQRYLAEGLTEELIVELARFRRLSVSSRSASFALVGSQLGPVEVGAMLGVRYLLEGQVRNVGDRVSIGLTLSETEQGTVVWGEKLQRTSDDLIGLIDETAAKIAATVSGRVEEAAMVAARRKRPENMTAFDCLLRGLDHHRLGGVTDNNARDAVKWFTRAIEADPTFSTAYAWRVCAASWLPDFDVEHARNDIKRALELEPSDAEANRVSAVLAVMDGNYDTALAHMRRAMQLNPSDAYIKARCAWIYNLLGQPTEALRLLDEAEFLDPLMPVYCVEERGVSLYLLGRYRDAVDAFGELAFQSTRSRLYSAASLVALDKLPEAEKLVREVLVSKHGLTAPAFLHGEMHRDHETSVSLGGLLRRAGLPA